MLGNRYARQEPAGNRPGRAGATAGLIYRAATRLPGDGSIVVAGAPHDLRRVIDLAGFGDARVVID